MKYEIQLNIGLEVSERFPEVAGPMKPSQVIDTLYDVAEHAGVSLLGLSHRVEFSSTEKTVVARIYFGCIDDAARFALHLGTGGYVDKLGQDCVAAYDPLEGFGALIGTHADLWGDFNRDYFIEW